MTTRAFFSFSLFLPILGGVLGALVSEFRVFGLSLVFGGFPYLLFTIGLAFLIGRSTTKGQLIGISLAAPLCFALVMVAFVGFMGRAAAHGLSFGDFLVQLWPVARYTLVFGYCYVIAAWSLWFLGRTFGLVYDEFAAT